MPIHPATRSSRLSRVLQDLEKLNAAERHEVACALAEIGKRGRAARQDVSGGAHPVRRIHFAVHGTRPARRG